MKYFMLTIMLMLANQIYAQHNTDTTGRVVDAVIYNIPFASKDNTIELSVQNISGLSLSGIKINVTDAPSWTNFKSKQKIIEAIASSGEHTTEFIFSVDKSAVVNKEESITFAISSPAGEVWMKQIKIVVTPPERFELYQNYPNPFNPATTIAYQTPNDVQVSLKIFDIVGREVATLVNEFRKAGYYEDVWNAGEFASGVYFYQLDVKEKDGKLSTAWKKFMLMK